MLIIGELTDLRNNKGSTDLTAMSLQIPVSGGKHNVLNLVFSLYVGELALDTRHSKVTASCSPCSHFLLTQPQPEGLLHHCLMQPSDLHYL